MINLLNLIKKIEDYLRIMMLKIITINYILFYCFFNFDYMIKILK